MKILVVKLNHLGDTLLMTPALRLLREHFPGAEVDAVVRAGCEAMLIGNPHVTRILTVPGAKTLLAVLGRRYDYAFDLSNSDRAKLLILASGARVRAINEWHARLGWKRHLFNRRTNFAWGPEHQVQRDYHAIADVLGSSGSPGPLHLNTEVEIDAPAGPYAVIHPVSRWRFKQWLPERWAAVANRLAGEGLQVLFSHGPGEEQHVDEILRYSKLTHSKTRPGSLRQLGRLIRGAKIFLGVDTVAMHIAAAVQTPTVALFGPSSEWSWHPWQVRQELVLGECPCKAARRFTCDKSVAFPCMQRITVEAVSAAAATLLAKPARTPSGSAGR